MPMQRQGSQVVLLSNGCWAEDAFDSSEDCDDEGGENTDYKVHLSRDDIEESIDEEEYDSDSDSSNESESEDDDTKACFNNDHEVEQKQPQVYDSSAETNMSESQTSLSEVFSVAPKYATTEALQKKKQRSATTSKSSTTNKRQNHRQDSLMSGSSPTPSQSTASTVASSMISTPQQQKSPHCHQHQLSLRTRLSENNLTNHFSPKMIDDDDDASSGTDKEVSEEQFQVLADDETWCPLKDNDIASSVVPEQTTSASIKTKKTSARRIQSQQQRIRNSNTNTNIKRNNKKKKKNKIRRGRREEHVKESLKSTISNHREQKKNKNKKTKNAKKKPEATSALSSKEEEKDQQLKSSDRNLFNMSHNNNNTSHTNTAKIDQSPTQPIRRKSLGLVPTVTAAHIDSNRLQTSIRLDTPSTIMKQRSLPFSAPRRRKSSSISKSSETTTTRTKNQRNLELPKEMSSLVASIVSPPVAKNAVQKKLKTQTSIIPGTRSRRIRRVSVKRESVTQDNNTATTSVVATDGGKDNARKNSCSSRTKKKQTKRNTELIPSSKSDNSRKTKKSHRRRSIGGERCRSSSSVPSSSLRRNSTRNNEERKPTIEQQKLKKSHRPKLQRTNSGSVTAASLLYGQEQPTRRSPVVSKAA